MPVEFKLLEHEKVATFKVAEPWSMAEIFAVGKQADLQLSAHAQPVYLIVDLSEVSSIPPNALAGRRNPMIFNPYCTRIIVVSSNPLICSIAETGLRLVGNHQFKFAGSVKQAMEIAAQQRVKLSQTQQLFASNG